jgi:hypothetical protein
MKISDTYTIDQLDLFDKSDCAPKSKNKKRNVEEEAKHLLEKHGISTAPRELKALIAAKLMAKHFPEMHKLLLMSLVHTSIKQGDDVELKQSTYALNTNIQNRSNP